MKALEYFLFSSMAAEKQTKRQKEIHINCMISLFYIIKKGLNPILNGPDAWITTLSWEGLLLMADFLTSHVKVIFTVKWV